MHSSGAGGEVAGVPARPTAEDAGAVPEAAVRAGTVAGGLRRSQRDGVRAQASSQPARAADARHGSR